jgi:hypothetical protein
MSTPTDAELQAMHAEAAALQAKTSLMWAQIAHQRAERALKGSIVDRPWFPWVVVPGAMFAGMAVAALIAR